jgi:CoA:oxalate CoA-transferase
MENNLLTGLRVLDFTRVMAGPFCTALLADLGAEVIKIEPAQGDDYRHIGPFKNGESGLFALMNRGKKSITVDLKSPAGLDIVHDLARRSDVVVENFRPGVTSRLKIDYASLSGLKDGLVYLSISGFGQSGPLAHRPAYDLIAQAMAGLMSVTGEPDRPPMRVGEAYGDLVSGLFGAWAILAAYVARLRGGPGRYIDIAMFDALFSMLPTSLSLYLFTGQAPTRSGNRHLISAPFGSFTASDGYVIIAVANNTLFDKLMTAMGRPEVVQDGRFRSDEERHRNEPELRAIIESWTARRPVAEIVEILSAATVPASPIWSVEQAATSSQAAFRHLIAAMHHPIAGDIRVLEQPAHFSGIERGKIGRPPQLGEHTASVLSDVLGYGADKIAALRADNVV